MRWAGLALLIIVVAGTTGYWFIGHKQYSFFDCFYMTAITISTIGYGEIIDMSHNPAGRMFTVLVAMFGIGTLTYMLSTFTAFIIEGDMNEAFRRRKMEKMIDKFSDHFIVCGIEGVGFHILNELHAVERSFVIVDINKDKIEKIMNRFPQNAYIVGDATDDFTLVKAGIERARGLFAVSGDDNMNMVISLTAKQLNPSIKIVARSHELQNIEKMKKAGADAVVSPTFIGGLRMASEMIRPAVVSFLDIMLRDKEKGLRIEEVEIPDLYTGKQLSALNLKNNDKALLMAAICEEGWNFNPPGNYIIPSGCKLVFMTTPEGKRKIEEMM